MYVRPLVLRFAFRRVASERRSNAMSEPIGLPGAAISFDVDRAALVVIDPRNDFLSSRGFVVRKVYGNLSRRGEELRRGGMP